MKGRLLLVVVAVVLLLALALPALPAAWSNGTTLGVASGVVYADDEPTPTPTPLPPNAGCHDGEQCGG